MARAFCGKFIPEDAPTALTVGNEASCESCLRIAERRAYVAVEYRKRRSWHIPKPVVTA